jgi:predicted ATPase
MLLQAEAKAEAEKCFWQAIEVAQRQGGKSLELRAVMSLSRLWHSEGLSEKKEAARQMLAEIYNWFTEGFDTADLQEAKALLEELSTEATGYNRPELAQQVAPNTPLTFSQSNESPKSEQVFTEDSNLYRQASSQIFVPSSPVIQAGQEGKEISQLFQVQYGLWALKQVQAELQTALNLAEQMLHLTQPRQDPLLLMPAHWMVGNILYWMGEFAPAQKHFEQSMALYDPQHHRSHVLLFGQDQGVACLSFQAWNLWHLGYPDQALNKSRAALTLAHELGHPYSLVYATNWCAQVHLKRREWQASLEQIEAEMTLSNEHGFPFWQVVGTILRGWVLSEQGQVEKGIVLMRQSLAAWRGLGAEVSRPYFLAPLVSAYAKVGQVEEGLNAVTEALAAVERTAEHLWEAELYRLRGELLLNASREGGGVKDESEAENCFWQAIKVARRQEAKSLELRAVMSLSQLWQRQDKKEEARQMLAEIYDWFTEGFDTADLREAKALLDAWRL